MTKQQLLRKFKNLSRVITRCADMDVSFEGNTAYQVPGKIVLPIGDFSDDNFVKMSLGYCDHELGHENYSTSEYYEIAHHESLFLKSLLNCLDDVHQETRLIAEFKGCKKTLRNLIELCKEQEIFGKPTDKWPEKLILTGWLLYGARLSIDQPLREYYQLADSLLRSKFGEDFYQKLHKIFNTSMMATIDNTEKCYLTAKEIYDLFLEWVDNLDDSSDSSDDSSDSGDSGDSSDDSSNSGDLSDSSGNSGSVSEIQVRKVEILESLDDDVFDFHGKLRAEIENMAKDYDGAEIMPSTPVFQAHPHTLDSDGSCSVNDDTHKLVSSLKNPLKRIFHDQNFYKVSLNKKGGYINPSRLATISTGNRKIFEKETVGRSPNAAVALLVDKSGSMLCEEMRIANNASYALSSALDGIRGVKSMVGYFPYHRNSDGNKLAIVKRFDAKAVKSNFNLISSGGTPTAEAVLTATSYLANQSEPRKLLFVITDGDANDVPQLREAIEDANSLGIKVFGIGIHLAVKGFEETDFTVITSENQLVGALTKGLKHAFN